MLFFGCLGDTSSEAMTRVSLPVYNVLKRLQPIYALFQDQLIRGTRATGWEKVGVALISAGIYPGGPINAYSRVQPHKS